MENQNDMQDSSNKDSTDSETCQNNSTKRFDLENGSKLNSNPSDLESTNQNLQSSNPESVDQSNYLHHETPQVVYPNGDWQAVYDPATNAYYFANSRTGETTWINPMIPSESNPSSTSHPQQYPDLGGIDPELARLDPQYSRLLHGHSSSSDPRFTARFNARTGRYESDPNRDPARVSEFARARTQTEAFFDVAGWEKSLEANNGRIAGTSKETRAAAIERGKKLTKAQLEQFKKQKLEKKARSQRAWLIGSK